MSRVSAHEHQVSIGLYKIHQRRDKEKLSQKIES